MMWVLFVGAQYWPIPAEHRKFRRFVALRFYSPRVRQAARGWADASISRNPHRM